MDDFKNKSVAVFGLGRSGQGAIEFLLKAHARIYAWDDDPQVREETAARCAGKNVTVALPETYPWDDMAMLVLSPGVPLTHPAPHKVVQLALAARCSIVCDVELLWLSAPEARYVGITGTNGKSTTTALTHHCIAQAGLSAEVGGNIGTAATRLPKLDADGVYVLELSSYQLDLLKKTRINIAVLLNITPDHIDRHGSMAGYIASKRRIFELQGAGGAAVIVVDDEYTRTLYAWLKADTDLRVIPVSNREPQQGGVAVMDGVIFDDIGGEGRKVELGDVKTLPGRHNAQNIAAAYAVLRALDIVPEWIVQAIHTFPGLAHRLQLVAEIEGIRFINDSKATNADAASHALASYEDIFWIAGGKAKEGGIASLEPFFPRIRHAFLIGEAENQFAATLEGRVLYTRSGTLEQAVRDAFKAARAVNSPSLRGVMPHPGECRGKADDEAIHSESPRPFRLRQGSGGQAGSRDDGILAARDPSPVILLSPACASFDQFKNFEQRGEMFAECAGKLQENITSAVL